MIDYTTVEIEYVCSYCNQSADSLQYLINNQMYFSDSEKQYIIGEISAYQDVLRFTREQYRLGY